MQHYEVTQAFPSGQLEEREEVDVAVVCCGFCEVKWWMDQVRDVWESSRTKYELQH